VEIVPHAAMLENYQVFFRKITDSYQKMIFQAYFGRQHEPVELWMEQLGVADVSNTSQGYSCT